MGATLQSSLGANVAELDDDIGFGDDDEDIGGFGHEEPPAAAAAAAAGASLSVMPPTPVEPEELDFDDIDTR